MRFFIIGLVPRVRGMPINHGPFTKIIRFGCERVKKDSETASLGGTNKFLVFTGSHFS